MHSIIIFKKVEKCQKLSKNVKFWHFWNEFLVLIWFNSLVYKLRQYSVTFQWRYVFVPINFEKMWNLEKNWKLSNFDILIYNIFFVNYNPYSGLVIIDNDFLLLWSEIESEVFLKPSSLVWHNRYLKICFFSEKMKILDLSLFFFDFLLEITDSQRN